MKKINLILFLLTLSYLTGCATVEKYEQMLDSWKGSSFEKLETVWGKPDGSYTNSDGNITFIYRWSKSTHIEDVGTVNHKCVTYFEMGPQNKVIGWSWKGNSCRRQ